MRLLRAAVSRGEVERRGVALDRRLDRAARTPGADRPAAPPRRRAGDRARPPAADRAGGSCRGGGRRPVRAESRPTGAPTLWAQGQTGRDVVVAVLDTGLDAGLPAARDLAWLLVRPLRAAHDALRRGLARARHRGRGDRRLDGAGRPHHRRARLQRRRPQHDQRRAPRVRVGSRSGRQPQDRRRAQRRQRLLGRRRAWPLREGVRLRHRGAARRRHRPRLRRGQCGAGGLPRARARLRRRARSPSAA